MLIYCCNLLYNLPLSHTETPKPDTVSFRLLVLLPLSAQESIVKAEEAKAKRKSAVAALRKNLHKLKKDEEGVKAAARAEEAQKKKDEELFKVRPSLHIHFTFRIRTL